MSEQAETQTVSDNEMVEMIATRLFGYTWWTIIWGPYSHSKPTSYLNAPGWSPDPKCGKWHKGKDGEDVSWFGYRDYEHKKPYVKMLTDRNAVHEMEKALEDKGLLTSYIEELKEIVRIQSTDPSIFGPDRIPNRFWGAFKKASPRQCCEAAYRVLKGLEGEK